jgi:hypothetical protein
VPPLVDVPPEHPVAITSAAISNHRFEKKFTEDAPFPIFVGISGLCD